MSLTPSSRTVTHASTRVEPARDTDAALTRRDALRSGAAGMLFLFSLNHVGPGVADQLARLASEGLMTGERLAGFLRVERSRWTDLLALVGPERMEVAGVEGAWSIKQIVGHLTWYERAVVEGARQVLGTGKFTKPQTGLRALTMDERNAVIAAETESRSLRDVLAESDQVFGELVAIIAAAPADLLNDPRVLGLPDELVPWMAVANNSYAHYQQHEQAIRAWLDQRAR